MNNTEALFAKLDQALAQCAQPEAHPHAPDQLLGLFWEWGALWHLYHNVPDFQAQNAAYVARAVPEMLPLRGRLRSGGNFDAVVKAAAAAPSPATLYPLLLLQSAGAFMRQCFAGTELLEGWSAFDTEADPDMPTLFLALRACPTNRPTPPAWVPAGHWWWTQNATHFYAPAEPDVAPWFAPGPGYQAEKAVGESFFLTLQARYVGEKRDQKFAQTVAGMPKLNPHIFSSISAIINNQLLIKGADVDNGEMPVAQWLEPFEGAIRHIDPFLDAIEPERLGPNGVAKYAALAFWQVAADLADADAVAQRLHRLLLGNLPYQKKWESEDRARLALVALAIGHPMLAGDLLGHPLNFRTHEAEVPPQSYLRTVIALAELHLHQRPIQSSLSLMSQWLGAVQYLCCAENVLIDLLDLFLATYAVATRAAHQPPVAAVRLYAHAVRAVLQDSPTRDDTFLWLKWFHDESPFQPEALRAAFLAQPNAKPETWETQWEYVKRAEIVAPLTPEDPASPWTVVPVYARVVRAVEGLGG